MATLFIYYSLGGKTDLVAKTLAKHLTGDLVRIHDMKQRTGIKNKFLSSINALR